MSKPTKTLSLRLPFEDFERLKKEAASFGKSVPDWARDKLRGSSQSELNEITRHLLTLRRDVTANFLSEATDRYRYHQGFIQTQVAILRTLLPNASEADLLAKVTSYFPSHGIIPE